MAEQKNVTPPPPPPPPSSVPRSYPAPAGKPDGSGPASPRPPRGLAMDSVPDRKR